MIEQYLLQTNENATVPKFKIFLKLPLFNNLIRVARMERMVQNAFFFVSVLTRVSLKRSVGIECFSEASVTAAMHL
jgi:hypothetical protein